MPLKDELELSVAFESNEALAGTIKHISTINPKTKDKQRANWKRCEFVKACIKRNIRLNINAEQNKKNYLYGLTGKRIRESKWLSWIHQC
ncbi:14663_t:CDS:2 [Gigaspora margarita]|uniref:14663_t:CDS:1 n=1 Tax=Gigaspora margarita TaxID=4874 RepID=A0ABN7VH05_GIGMA|nr:14663_t:CDS:2 [Gigaspora margarita]